MVGRLIANSAWFLFGGMVVGAGLTGNALAESFKDKTGRAVYVPTSVEDLKQPDGSIVRTQSLTGISMADLPFPFDYVKHQCTGTVQIGADGKPGRAHGYCEILSSKGDRGAFTYVGDAAGGRFAYIDGADGGAYAGLKGDGTYKFKAAMPGGGIVTEWTATWQTN
jgi:hypothetical protein